MNLKQANAFIAGAHRFGASLFGISKLCNRRCCSLTFEDFYGGAYQGMRIAERKLLNLIDIYREETQDTYDLQPIIYTCSRIKSPKKILEKLERKGFEPTLTSALNQVYDAIGVRAVCAFAEDVYRLAEWMHSRQEIDILEEKDYYANPKPNGYRSYHILLRIKQESGDGFHAELQIRTIANDFWATLEHRLKYKKNIPHEEVIQEELKRCAFEIASVDASMQAIRDLLKEKS